MSTALPQPYERFTEPELVEVSIDCECCDAKGFIEGLVPALGSPLSGPWESGTQRCPNCEGMGYLMVERCESCLKSETECCCFEWRD